MLSNLDQDFLKGSQLAILLASYTQLPKGLSCCLFQRRECPVLALVLEPQDMWWQQQFELGADVSMTRSNTTIILGLSQQQCHSCPSKISWCFNSVLEIQKTS